MEESPKKIEPAILGGFMELLPDEQMLFNKMLDTIRKSYELFGFIPLDTPLIEKANVLLAKGGGETDKQIYQFKKGDNDLALRFDLTVPLSRYVAQHYSQLQFPFRRYHIGKVYRGERPQKGRYREFYQCDIDIIGDGQLNLINDAEIPSVIYRTFCNLGFKSFTIRINNRKILNGFFQFLKISDKSVEVLRIIDKLDKFGKESIVKEFEDAGLDQNVIKTIFDFISIKGDNDEVISKLKDLNIDEKLFILGVEELDSVIKAISRFGVPKDNFKIDLTIARGLDYYTGTVYETVLNDYPEIGSVCSGGRFDNLAECYTDKKLPGVGISIGLTRLFSKLLESKAIQPTISTPAQILVVPLDGQLDEAIKVAAEFRFNGISSIVYLEQQKIAKMFRYADKLKVPFVAIIGGDEAKEGKVSLKDMKNNHQGMYSIQEAVKFVIEQNL